MNILLLFLLTSPALSLASPNHHQRRSQELNSIPLIRRTPTHHTHTDAWAKAQAAKLRSKYNPDLTVDDVDGDGSTRRKRASGANALVNSNGDSSYFGSLFIGSPPRPFNVILDTGSSDLWIAGSNCVRGCQDVPETYNPRDSQTYQNLTRAFNIRYGSGAASGSLGQDVVQMAGFQVNEQAFGICDVVSANLLLPPLAGLMGLGFQAIASSRAIPFWQRLVEANTWNEPLFSFYLTRYLPVSDEAREQEPGGEFLMGATNPDLYVGEIDYNSIPEGHEGFWTLPMTTLTVQNNSISLPGGTGSHAAIDTGTTLVGGPSALIAQIFAQIPGALKGSGEIDGYWVYPCETEVRISMGFGTGRIWQIDPRDFELARFPDGMCLGAFFELNLGPNAPAWIVGDTFLKNVYSVYRYDPPAVGFGELSELARSQNEVLGQEIATPTLVENPVIPTGGANNNIGGGPTNNGGTILLPRWLSLLSVVLGTMGLVSTI